MFDLAIEFVAYHGLLTITLGLQLVEELDLTSEIAHSRGVPLACVGSRSAEGPRIRCQGQ
jgi:hypothetical protein